MTKNDDGMVVLPPRSLPISRNTGLKGLRQDEKPPQFNIRQQFNDKVPFNFASGEVGVSGQPRAKAQVSLTRADDAPRSCLLATALS